MDSDDERRMTRGRAAIVSALRSSRQAARKSLPQDLAKNTSAAIKSSTASAKSLTSYSGGERQKQRKTRNSVNVCQKISLGKLRSGEASFIDPVVSAKLGKEDGNECRTILGEIDAKVGSSPKLSGACSRRINAIHRSDNLGIKRGGADNNLNKSVQVIGTSAGCSQSNGPLVQTPVGARSMRANRAKKRPGSRCTKTAELRKKRSKSVVEATKFDRTSDAGSLRTTKSRKGGTEIDSGLGSRHGKCESTSGRILRGGRTRIDHSSERKNASEGKEGVEGGSVNMIASGKSDSSSRRILRGGRKGIDQAQGKIARSFRKRKQHKPHDEQCVIGSRTKKSKQHEVGGASCNGDTSSVTDRSPILMNMQISTDDPPTAESLAEWETKLHESLAKVDNVENRDFEQCDHLYEEVKNIYIMYLRTSLRYVANCMAEFREENQALVEQMAFLPRDGHTEVVFESFDALIKDSITVGDEFVKQYTIHSEKFIAIMDGKNKLSQSGLSLTQKFRPHMVDQVVSMIPMATGGILSEEKQGILKNALISAATENTTSMCTFKAKFAVFVEATQDLGRISDVCARRLSRLSSKVNVVGRECREAMKAILSQRDEKAEGLVHLWQGFSPPSIKTFSVFDQLPIQKVAIGHAHCTFLTRCRQLFVYGSNSHGQLGIGTPHDCYDEPMQVPLLRDVQIVDMACGPQHSAAVTSEGQVYCWGDSSSGQCGQLGRFYEPNPISITEPTTICCHGNQSAPAPVVVRQIGCGDCHMMALSDVGELWVWGTGMQLGLNSPDQIFNPVKLEYLEGRRVLSISCGSQHTVALVQKLKRSKLAKTESTGSRGSKDSIRSDSLTDSSVSSNIQVHRYRPSTCVQCKEDIYTYHDKGDTCIITSQHKCPLGLEVGHNNTPKLERRESSREKSSDRSTGAELLKMDTLSSSIESLEKRVSFTDSTIEADEEKELRLAMTNCDKRQSLSVDLYESTAADDKLSPGRMMPRSGSAMADLGATSHHCKTEVKLRKKDKELPKSNNKTTSEAKDKAPEQVPLISVENGTVETDGDAGRAADVDCTDNSAVHKFRHIELSDIRIAESALNGQMDSDSEDPAGTSKTEGGLTKSRSTFLDETQAKEFLEKHLYGDDDSDMSELSDSQGPMSPLVKRVENILAYVPSPPAAVQEYVSTITKNVVSNIRTSFDKFGLVAPGDVDSLSKSSSQDSVTPPGSRTPKESSPSVRRRGEFDFGVSGQGSDMKTLGGMTRSVTMDMFLHATSSHQDRKSSLPAVLPRTTSTVCLEPEVVLETEVWTWGKGRRGQLGHGDLLDRPNPCAVKFFSDLRVVKVVAGPHHNMALTTNSKVYGWGLNSDGQLGLSKASTANPHQLSTLDGTPMWDVAVGQLHSIVLADGAGFAPDIFYTGSQCIKEGVEKTSQLMRLSGLRRTGWVRQIFAGGDMCACVTDRNTTGFIATLHEFASTERLLQMQLTNMSEHVLKPLLHSDCFKAFETSSLGVLLRRLLEAFQSLLDMVARNCVELSRVIQGRLEVDSLFCIAKSDEYMAVFQHYSKCFGDALALGSFEQCAKSASAFLDKVKDKIAELVEENKMEKSSVALTFRRLLQVPLHRLREYHRILSKLALRYPTFTGEDYSLNRVAQSWEALTLLATTEHTLAENTRKFWDSCPPKFARKLEDVLRSPGRRLLRESKANLINVANSGRFAMHWLLLFNDVFVHGQYSMHQTFPLPTIWVESMQDTDSLKNAITLTMPEETLTLTAPTPLDKAEWLWAINQATVKILSDQKNLIRPQMSSELLSPPLLRHATHVFYKHPLLKDAKYMGMWLAGKMHGQGELVWPDERKYVGRFKQGLQHGHGIYSVPKDGGTEVFEGEWKEGKMNGYGTIKYAIGDLYEGYFQDSKKHGHGILKQGKFLAAASPASIYIGEWVQDKKMGYGVLDDISKGQKYMGMWQDDSRHGNGIIVTLDGMYYEGNFVTNKMMGFGLLMTDDNSCYEGDFSGGPNLHGKGKLTLPNGDYIDGHFSGSFTEGIKTNGTFYKASEPHTEKKGFTHAMGILPKTYGSLSVAANRKWQNIFLNCYRLLGCQDDKEVVESNKAWEAVAVMVAGSRKVLRETRGRHQSKLASLEDLEKIPPHSRGRLNLEDYEELLEYLVKAFDTPLHPLGKLMEELVDVYRATYVGVGAHPRLLHHAVQEVKSYVCRIYRLVRVLFPDLPPSTDPIQIFSQKLSNVDEDTEDDSDWEGNATVVTPEGLLHSLLLPRIYPPLFMLYALYNEKEDEKYWKRVHQWNKQGDMALMASLGMDQKFWLFDENSLHENGQRISRVKDVCYKEAIEMLQHITTSFSPAEKLSLIQKTFDEINKAVQSYVGNNYLWSMDDLFPVFLYVVVRACIRHLGAEIHFIDDLMENHLENGELGIMFTTLKACYYQIQNERVS